MTETECATGASDSFVTSYPSDLKRGGHSVVGLASDWFPETWMCRRRLLHSNSPTFCEIKSSYPAPSSLFCSSGSINTTVALFCLQSKRFLCRHHWTMRERFKMSVSFTPGFHLVFKANLLFISAGQSVGLCHLRSEAAQLRRLSR